MKNKNETETGCNPREIGMNPDSSEFQGHHLVTWWVAREKRIVYAFVAAVIMFGITSLVWEKLPVPHHVVVKLGNRVLRDYWTSDRYNVVKEVGFGDGRDYTLPYEQILKAYHYKTNQLW